MKVYHLKFASGMIEVWKDTEENVYKMISGKVVDISKDKGIYTISTHNGSIFYVKKNSIVWVKMGSRWPVGIYNALKYRGN